MTPSEFSARLDQLTDRFSGHTMTLLVRGDRQVEAVLTGLSLTEVGQQEHELLVWATLLDAPEEGPEGSLPYLVEDPTALLAPVEGKLRVLERFLNQNLIGDSLWVREHYPRSCGNCGQRYASPASYCGTCGSALTLFPQQDCSPDRHAEERTEGHHYCVRCGDWLGPSAGLSRLGQLES